MIFSTFAKNFSGLKTSFYSRSLAGFFFGSLFCLILVTKAYSQPPAGYYDPAAGLTGTALQAALHNIIKGHTVVSYSSIPGFFPSTDAKPGNVVWDMYSDVPGGTPPYIYHYNMGQECGSYSGEGDCYNREHSWPKSWFNDVSPPYSDLFHIYPTDGYVNGRRSNYAYGTVSSASWTSQNGCKLGTCNWPGFSGTAFEPLNEYKGDFARTYFYMSTRYYTEDSGWSTSDMTNKSVLKPWALQMMLHWCSVDPVSAKETARNNAVYAIQHNRNPFIDHPEYAYMIWGNPVGTGDPETQRQLHIWPNPASDQVQVELPEGTTADRADLVLISVTGSSFSPQWSADGGILTVDVRPYAAGVYMLLMKADGLTARGKVVVR